MKLNEFGQMHTFVQSPVKIRNISITSKVPSSPHPCFPATTDLISDARVFLCCTFIWMDHRACTDFCVYFTEPNLFTIIHVPVVCPFYCCAISHYVNEVQFIPSPADEHSNCFQFILPLIKLL